jgi:hypothetical protein
MSRPSIEELVNVLRSWALSGDENSSVASWPLSAVSHKNTADHWWGATPSSARKKLTRRNGNPAITVYCQDSRKKWVVTVISSKNGKSIAIAVPKGTPIIEVDEF